MEPGRHVRSGALEITNLWLIHATLEMGTDRIKKVCFIRGNVGAEPEIGF